MTRVGSKRARRKSVNEEMIAEAAAVQGKAKRSRKGVASHASPLEGIEKATRPKRITRRKEAILIDLTDEAESSMSNPDYTDIPRDSLEDIEKCLDELLDKGGKENVQEYLKFLRLDQREGVKALVKDFKGEMHTKTAEEKRLHEMMSYERKAIEMERVRCEDEVKFDEYLKESFFIVGVDEVGVGPLAGPIVSCAVAFQYPTLLRVLPLLDGINDSKKLHIIKRKELSKIIKEECCATYNLGVVTAKEVDELNPRQGSIVAMGRAVTNLNLPAKSCVHVLVDHHTIPNLPKDTFREQTSITKGDSKSVAIAAASIIAKVYRDEYMSKLHTEYPNFGFDRNAGYGTAQHLKELHQGHLCPEHRLSYEPVKVAHRKANGLESEDPPKKKRRAAKEVVIPEGVSPIQSQDLPKVVALDVEASEKVAVAPALFSPAWWSSWFVSRSL